MIGGQRRMTAVLVGINEILDVPVGVQFPGKSPGIEDQVVAFRRPSVEFHLRAALQRGDLDHVRIDVARARALVQQVRHHIGGQVVGVGDLLRCEEVGEVPVATTPALECNSVLASAIQSLLDGFMGQVRQLLQFLDQARPTAFTHSDDRDARVIDVMQLVVAVRVKARDAGGRQGTCGSSSDNRDLPQGFAAWLNHAT